MSKDLKKVKEGTWEKSLAREGITMQRPLAWRVEGTVSSV